MSVGYEGKAKGAIGCWLVLAEWAHFNDEWHRTNVKTFAVDGVLIKENTFYKMVAGEAVEA
jgi:hypothetical protein